MSASSTHCERFDSTFAQKWLNCIFSAALAVGTLVGGSDAARQLHAADQDAMEQTPKARQEDEPDRIAGYVRIRLPLTGSDDESLKVSLMRTRDRLVADALRKLDPARPLLVLEVSPASGAENAGAGTQFERASALATFVGRMGDVKTIAWIPQSIRGHGVLVALACEEIVMAPDATIGDAGADEEGFVADSTVQRYREVAVDLGVRLDEALAVGMIDRAAEVVKVQSEEGVRFLLRDEVDDYAQDHEIIAQQTIATPGNTVSLSGREGRELGFVKYLAGDRRALAGLLEAPVASLEEDVALSGEWRPIIIDIDEPIDEGVKDQVLALLGRQLDEGANWICLRIDSPGGDVTSSTQLAAVFAELDPEEVRTVAYVPQEARGGAALTALACDQLVMHADAVIGAPFGSRPATSPIDAAPPVDEADDDLRRLAPWNRQPVEEAADESASTAALTPAEVTSVRSLARDANRTWSLFQAMVDPSLELSEYRNRTTGEQRLMSVAEATGLPDAVDWIQGPALQAKDRALELTGEEAEQLGVAWRQVDTFDELKRLYGIKSEPIVVEPNWALQLIQALASPEIAWFLLLLGFAGLYIELKTPGVGIGGFLATVAFILFFWSNFLDGSATWFEVLMFIAGFLFLLIEVFVLPGFGIFGLGGGVLIILSLVLASQRFFIPRTESQLDELRRSITMVAAAGVGMMAFAWVSRRYLPQAPILGRIMLEPPPPEERQLRAARESMADYAHLVGAAGRATTHLRPAGKALVDDELIDVIAEGEPIERGTAIVVVDAHANRVLVRAADNV